MRVVVTLFLACASIAPAAAANTWQTANAVQVEVINPRSFGYVLGDTPERRIIITGPRALAYEPESLPQPGARTPWLTLIGTTVESKDRLRSHRYEFRFRYQVTNAPTDIRPAALPSLHLRFKEAARTIDASVDEWGITVGPIIPAGMRADATPLRPDQLPQRLSVVPALAGIVLCLGLAVAIAIFLICMPWMKRYHGPFAQAYRAVRRAAAQPDRRQGYQAALRALHRAFDETARKRVFADTLDEFTTKQPRFADLREGTEKFLRLSQRAFFGGEVSSQETEFDWLLQFCRDCRARERESS